MNKCWLAVMQFGNLAAGLSPASSFESFWIEPTAWNALEAAGAEFGSSSDLCLLACLKRAQASAGGEICESFAVVDSVCQFGTIDAASQCRVLLEKGSDNALQVFAAKGKYDKETIYEVHVPQLDNDPTYMGTIPPSSPCTGTGAVNIPVHQLHTVSIKHVQAGRGIFQFPPGTISQETYFWEPGMETWSGPFMANGLHNQGACATSLGTSQAAVLGHNDNVGTSIFEIFSNGAWDAKAPFPVATFDCTMMAVNSKKIYVMGGQNAVDKTYRYDVPRDKWTMVDNMPHAQRIPKCGRTFYDGKPSILCMGVGKNNGINKLKGQVFDLGTETWTDLGFKWTWSVSGGGHSEAVVVDGVFHRTYKDKVYLYFLGNHTFAAAPVEHPSDRAMPTGYMEVIFKMDIVRKIN